MSVAAVCARLHSLALKNPSVVFRLSALRPAKEVARGRPAHSLESAKAAVNEGFAKVPAVVMACWTRAKFATTATEMPAMAAAMIAALTRAAVTELSTRRAEKLAMRVILRRAMAAARSAVLKGAAMARLKLS